jgi:hypothetical protein
MKSFHCGDPVVYSKNKFSLHPGPRAQDVHATRHGDGYLYLVDKYWTVVGSDTDGRLLVRTRRGKTHHIASDDPRLRHATLWERLRYRARFPRLAEPVSEREDPPRPDPGAPPRSGT